MAGTALAREEVLDREECLRLLGTRRLGRVAVAVEGWSPLIRPVNYRFDPSSQNRSVVGPPSARGRFTESVNSRLAAPLTGLSEHGDGSHRRAFRARASYRASAWWHGLRGLGGLG